MQVLGRGGGLLAFIRAQHPNVEIKVRGVDIIWVTTKLGNRKFRREDKTHIRVWLAPLQPGTHPQTIESYIDRHNENPKPFIWTARAGDILEKVKRARQALNKRHSA